MPGLYVYRSNRIEVLADALATLLLLDELDEERVQGIAVGVEGQARLHGEEGIGVDVTEVQLPLEAPDLLAEHEAGR